MTGILDNILQIKALLIKLFCIIVLKKCTKVCNYIKNDIIFAINRTRHASHLNSAPRRVFDFYGGYVI